MKFKRSKEKRSGLRKRLLAGLFAVGLIVGILATQLYNPAKASAGISYLGQSTATVPTAAATIAITTPAGIAAGNTLIAQIMALPGQANSVAITAPSGWTLIGTSPSANKYTMSLYYHVVASGDPTSYSWSFSPNSTATGGITAFSGVATASPIDVTTSQANGTSTSHSAPSVTASYSNGVVVPFWGFQAGIPATSIDASLTSIWNTDNTVNSGIASGYVQLTNAGATGTYTATTATSTPSLAQTIALQPAAAAAGVQYVAVTAPALCVSCTSISAVMPTGWKSGDLFITSVAWNTNTATITTPSGWAQIDSNITTGSFAQADYYRYASTGDPNSYNFAFSGTVNNAMISTVEFQGVDQTNPIDVSGTALSASGSTHAAPSVTTTVAQDMLFDIWSWNTGTNATAITNTMTKIWDAQSGNASTNVSSAAGYELVGLAGATGTRTVTSGRTAIAMMHSIAIKPALPAPQLLAPANASHPSLTPTFQMVSATLVGNLQYIIQLCSTNNCAPGTILTTYDQTLSQAGWTGQNANAGTAYIAASDISSSTTATYTAQTPLTECTTYYWRARGYDPSITQGYNYSQTRSFSTSCRPSAPTLYTPTAGQTGVRLLPEFKLASTDLDNDYVKYKIEFCSNSSCSAIINIWDQTLSQTNWTGQTANSFTAYNTDATTVSLSNPAVYTVSSNLTGNTQYWWRAYAIDPLGTNTWSSASAIQSFTTNLSETRILEGRLLQTTIL
ncbi:hypothetical protein H7Y63_03570 [Polaromonas sp.]|nr:hypothetical protein [Candidatus Saccharibacteria bacterium]